MASAGYMEPHSTGGSSRSHLASRNPYRGDPDGDELFLSRNPYWTPGASAAGITTSSSSADPNRSSSMPTIPRRKPLPVSRENSYGTGTGTGTTSSREDIYSASPPLFPPPIPMRPTVAPIQHQQQQERERRPPLPPRPHTLDEYPTRLSPHGRVSAIPMPPPQPAPAPTLPPRPVAQEQRFFAFRRRLSQISNRENQVMQLPPRRLQTTEDVPVNSVGYTRNPERVVAYLIPLPPPMYKGQPMKVPQRYMIYTPPAPHLLKPTQGKEGKRHKVKRLAQEEVKKAKTFQGKTLSLRGLHSKTLRGVDWAVAAVKNADITFLNRVPRHQVSELVLIHPASLLENESPEEIHREFRQQLARTKRRAAKHSVVSTALFGPAVVIDTFAAVIWPFGGLAEIDGVWMYTSMSGYLTARSVSKRLDTTPLTTAGVGEQTRLARQLRGEEGDTTDADSFSQPLTDLEDVDLSAGIAESGNQQQPPRRGTGGTRQVRFQEELDEEDEKLKAKNAAAAKAKNDKKKVVKVRFVPDEAMDTMSKYFQEICHKRNPKKFPSPGLPPTKTDVLASIGWQPERRVRAPGQDQSEGVWEDENWQSRQAKEDMDKVMMKAAKSWDKWCKSYAKYPQRAMKEKGHSRVSEVMRKLRIKKDGPSVCV